MKEQGQRMEQIIEVSRMGGAWWVLAEGCLEPTCFLSGGRAEEAARRLACSLADSGRDARVLVRDTQDVVVGAHRYFGL
jgi:hypothetical protein